MAADDKDDEAVLPALLATLAALLLDVEELPGAAT